MLFVGSDTQEREVDNMSARNFLYSQLCSIPSINLLGGIDNPRIWTKRSMTSAYTEMPYLTFKLGVDANLDLAEGLRITRQYFMVTAHDVDSDSQSDYGRIDTLLKEVKEQLHLANSTSGGVITTEFIETSQDFNDDTLNTLFKYSRFSFIKNDR